MVQGIRDKTGFVAALCLAAFGSYVTSTGSKLAYVSDVGPGPGFFPFWIGIGMLLFSCYQIILCVLAPGDKGPSAEQTNWHGSSRALAGWLAMAASIFLYRWIGFAAGFVLLTCVFIVGLERRPILPALAIGVALALTFHLLFVVALGVSLPAGPWGF
ncbi:MAG TPA: tripartite tricarboxylate transporter TctB family protein [Candidatus Limnocylindrales bacterium]|nr:tripartite tricarboxylate transporter TctB family protein [Candidatus Limnocylindrales bacterium]